LEKKKTEVEHSLIGEGFVGEYNFFQFSSRCCRFSHITMQEELEATTINNRTRKTKKKQHSQTMIGNP